MREMAFLRKTKTEQNSVARLAGLAVHFLGSSKSPHEISISTTSSRHKNIVKHWKNFRNIPCLLKILNSVQMTILLQKTNFPIVHTLVRIAFLGDANL